MSLLELYAIGAPVIALALMGLFGLLLFRRDVAGFALLSAGTAKANSEPGAETTSRAVMAGPARFAAGEPVATSGAPDTSTTHRPTLLAAQEAPAPRNLSSSSSRKARERAALPVIAVLTEASDQWESTLTDARDPGRIPAGIEAQMPEGKPADPTQPDREIPDKLLRGMRATVPAEHWGRTEHQLRRAYNMRLRQSEEIAAAFIERETQAFKNAARKSSRLNLAKAAAAAVAAAARSLTKYLWR